MRLAFAIALVALCAASARADVAINTVIGDASWAGHAEPGDEVTRVRAHLAFAHDELAARDVSELAPAQRAARAASLADLSRYTDRGVFPRRTNDGYAGRRPRFIDDRGVHCAVGELIADSGDEDLAQVINARFEYAHVREMAEPALAAWATAHGFTVDDLALIQPSYHGAPEPDSVRRTIVDAKDRIALECARTFTPMTGLLVSVTSTKHGAAIVSTKSTDPFAQCFVRAASALERGGHAYDEELHEFTLGIDLSLPTPQEQLEKTIEKWKPSCMPRPGAIAREATVEVSSTNEALVVDVKTTPSNALVESCMQEEATNTFRRFAPGAWKLHAVKKIALPPHVRFDPQAVRQYARDAATVCYPSSAARTKSTVTITAKPDDPQFTIVATGSAQFSTCVGDALNKHFVRAYRTSYVSGGKRIELFRIDADVKLSVTFDLESAAARMQRLHRERDRDQSDRNQMED